MSRKLFRTVILGTLILGIGKLVRFRAHKMEDRAWAMAGGPQGSHRVKHHSRWAKHRQKPSRFRTCKGPSEDKSEKVEPDAATGAVEVES